MKVTVIKGPMFEKKEIEAYRFIQEILKKQAQLQDENKKEA